MLDPLKATRAITDDYRRYLASTFSPRTPYLRKQFLSALTRGIRLTRGPYLQASPPFVEGASVQDLMREGVVSRDFSRFPQASFPVERNLYLHQEQSVRKGVAGRNLIVATGTGSGKTECFLIPIIDHLLREKERGTLEKPGVRAMLLYPMNALANDQIKRLRRLLATFPELTFGRYVGETPAKRDAAEEDFKARYPFEPRVANELLSRNEMQERPPHILLTNYAMLEYLLLRPDDSPLFDGATGGHWRFVVLDEVHVYDGAQGAEIAALLRRVRDRVNTSQRGRLQCFATSATLGRGEGDYPDLIRFAETLFDEPFEWNTKDPALQDVIGPTRKPLRSGEAKYRLPREGYAKLLASYLDPQSQPEELKQLARELAREAPSLDSSVTREQYLAELLSGDERVLELQSLLEEGSLETVDAAKRVFGTSEAEPDLVSLIGLAVVAKRSAEDAPAIPARYHFLLRSLEGAFVCLHPDHPGKEPALLLARHQSCPSCVAEGRDAAMLELGTCRRCGAEYLSGTLEESRLLSSSKPGQITHLLLGDAVEADDEDETALLQEDAGSAEVKLLCPGCARLLDDATAACDCSRPPSRRKVTVAQPAKGSDVLRRCVACAGRTNGEIVTRFLTGTDAPVAVIATSIYQELPPSRDEVLARDVGQGRKLLTFSDSRQDAAFFAPYLERTYRRAVQRRLILGAIESLSGDIPRTEDLSVPVRREAESCLVLDPDVGALSNTSTVRSWVMEEIMAVDRRQSLEGTGSVDIAIAFPRKFQPPPALTSLGFDASEVEDLIRMLLETLRVAGAITFPEGVDVRDERFAPRNREIGCRADGSAAGVLSWLPGNGSNRRLDIIQKIVARRDLSADPMVLLKGIWDYLTNPGNGWEGVLVPYGDRQHGALWRLAHDRFEFVLASERHRPLRCDSCRQLWWRSVSQVCPSFRCQGSVSAIDDLAQLTENHYASLYRRLLPIGIDVEEHTAQWTASEASRVQDRFMRGDVNVLSCSTTFELGVDVGEVEAVLLRNVPPTAANYVQRAGRAGRRTDAAALVVTFAQRRSHDLTQFDSPQRMIDGVIPPPRIYLENHPIIRRHVHSVAFAAFERLDGLHRTVAEFFWADEGKPASEQFVEWLRTHPTDLGAALQRIVPAGPAQNLGLTSWAWVDALIEPTEAEPTQGWLLRAHEEVKDDIGELKRLISEAANASKFDVAARLERQRRTLAERNLLGFLASRNILPKYGFPVDVVPLDLARSGDRDAVKLDLDRDLKLAISEYAPGAEVVAAKALWKSLGLRVRPQRDWPTRRWATCGDCGAFRHGIGTVAEECTACGSHAKAPGKAGTFVIPVFGFVGTRSTTSPGETRPPRMATTETFFGEYQAGDPTKLEPVPELSASGRLVERRFSRQGRITLVNRGHGGRGFRICEWCGYAESAPTAATPRSKRAAKETHKDIRRPGGQCSGTLTFRHLGHEYLTDVLELRLEMPNDVSAARSTLYALLAGVDSLAIRRDDMDGTLHWFTRGAPALVLFDAVPGGAGHAQRVGKELERVFRAAYEHVATCECGEETSCYNCLRSYTNQLWHEELSRGRAAAVLANHVER